LFLTASKAVFMQSSKLKNEQFYGILLEDDFNFSSLLMIPFRQLIISKKVDSNLKDAVMNIFFAKRE